MPAILLPLLCLGIDLRESDLVAESIAAEDHAALVVLYAAPGCRVAEKNVAKLNRMAAERSAEGVRFLTVLKSPPGRRDRTVAWCEQVGLSTPVVLDEDGSVAESLDAVVSPEAFVFEPGGLAVYRGLIDDQHSITRPSYPEPSKTYLADALDGVLAGEAAIRFTHAEGCTTRTREFTFARDVRPILEEKCVSCHRPGDIQDSVLLTSFEDAHFWADAIGEQVSAGLMPPWYAHHRSRPMRNDLSLSLNERWAIASWVRGGAKAGDLGQTRTAAKLSGEWRIGEPDAVFDTGTDFEVPAEGVLPYKHFVVDQTFAEDKWLVASELRPGARDVVHHVNLYLLPPESERMRPLAKQVAVRKAYSLARKMGLDFDPASAGVMLDLYGPRAQNRLRIVSQFSPAEPVMIFPEHGGYRVPAGAQLMFEVHYTPNGYAARTDRTKVAVKFADSVPEDWRLREPIVRAAGPLGRIDIDPDSTHTVEFDYPFYLDAELYSLKPHMHYRGRRFEATLIDPSGREDRLLTIPEWDYDQQLPYAFAKPVPVPAGSTLRVTYFWDNTPANPAITAEQAAQRVRIGLRTRDEMGMSFPSYRYVGATPDEIAEAEARVEAYLKQYVRIPETPEDGD